jgi:hypothetical protein
MIFRKGDRVRTLAGYTGIILSGRRSDWHPDDYIYYIGMLNKQNEYRYGRHLTLLIQDTFEKDGIE